LEGQIIKLTTNEIHEIENLIKKFSEESECTTCIERVIRKLEFNGKSYKMKVIIEAEEDYFEDIFTD
jgi:hypothetical protein